MARGFNQIKADIKAAARAGDEAALRPLLSEFRASMASAQRSQENAAEQYSPTDGMSGFGKLATGAASGLVNVGRRAGQILTPKSMEARLGVSDQDIENQSETDAPLASTLPGAIGRFASEAALTAPVGGVAGGAVKSLLSAARLGKAIPAIAGLATEGAVGGELTSGDAASGALWNLGIAGGLQGAKRLMQGSKNVTPEARRLLDEGVDLTPGQMSPRGAMSQLEQGAERVPIIGPHVQSQRRQLVPSAMRRLFEKEFGSAIPEGAGFDDMVRMTNKELGTLYDDVRAAASNVKAGGGHELQREWAKAVNSPDILVSPESRKASGRWLAGQMDALKTRGSVTVEDLLQVRSRLRDEVRKAFKSGQGAAMERAEVLEAAEGALTSQINNALPESAQKLLQETDTLYSRFKPLEQAGFQAAARAGGEPTIGQLVGALKQQAGQSKWAGRGAGRNQQFLEDVRDAAETTLRPTGAALPYMAAGAALSPITALGMTKTGRRLYSGRTAAQRAAQRAAAAAKTTPGVRTLIEILRRGSAGALADHTGD